MRAAPLRTVGARLVDERLEQRRVLAFLRMPEDAERESARRVLERLDRPVIRPRRRDEALADPPEPLVVARLPREALADDRTEPAAGVDPALVVGELAEPLLVPLVPEGLGEMLVEVAAARDVQ